MNNIEKIEKLLKQKPPKLIKKSTYPEYARWIRGIRVTLKEEGTWDEDMNLPINAENDDINDTVINYIESQMDSTLLDEVSNHENGSTLIQELKACYECKRKKEGSAAKKAYYSLHSHYV